MRCIHCLERALTEWMIKLTNKRKTEDGKHEWTRERKNKWINQPAWFINQWIQGSWKFRLAEGRISKLRYYCGKFHATLISVVLDIIIWTAACAAEKLCLRRVEGPDRPRIYFISLLLFFYIHTWVAWCLFDNSQIGIVSQLKTDYQPDVFQRPSWSLCCRSKRHVVNPYHMRS